MRYNKWGGGRVGSVYHDLVPSSGLKQPSEQFGNEWPPLLEKIMCDFGIRFCFWKPVSRTAFGGFRFMWGIKNSSMTFLKLHPPKNELSHQLQAKVLYMLKVSVGFYIAHISILSGCKLECTWKKRSGKSLYDYAPKGNTVSFKRPGIWMFPKFQQEFHWSSEC